MRIIYHTQTDSAGNEYMFGYDTADNTTAGVITYLNGKLLDYNKQKIQRNFCQRSPDELTKEAEETYYEKIFKNNLI